MRAEVQRIEHAMRAAQTLDSNNFPALPKDAPEETRQSWMSSIDTWFTSSGWSGTVETFLNGQHDFSFKDGHARSEAMATSGAGEVNVRTLSKELQEDFKASDAKEWGSVNGSGATRALDRQTSDSVRIRFPDRI